MLPNPVTCLTLYTFTSLFLSCKIVVKELGACFAGTKRSHDHIFFTHFSIITFISTTSSLSHLTSQSSTVYSTARMRSLTLGIASTYVQSLQATLLGSSRPLFSLFAISVLLLCGALIWLHAEYYISIKTSLRASCTGPHHEVRTTGLDVNIDDLDWPRLRLLFQLKA